MSLDCDGLHRISAPRRKNPRADIVFVHGIIGGSHSTWTHEPGTPKEFFWPQQLAKDLPDCAVWSVGYPAGLTVLGPQGMMHEARARNLADKLANARIGSRPIIFITHSMGGLVVKSLVADGGGAPGSEPETMANAVAGIVFCATPHRGADIANAAVKLGKLAGGCQKYVRELLVSNEQLGVRHRHFIEWQRRRDVPICSFAENVPYSRRTIFFLRPFVPGIIVSATSADPNIAGYQIKTVDEDHISIAKPSSVDHDVYSGALRFIRDILTHAQPAARPRTPRTTTVGRDADRVDRRIRSAIARVQANDDSVPAERNAVAALLELEKEFSHLAGHSDALLRKSIEWAVNDDWSWNVGLRAAILAATIAAKHGLDYKWTDDSEISAYLTGSEPVGRAYRILPIVILFAPDPVSLRIAEIVQEALRKQAPEKLEHPNIIMLDALRVSLVAAAQDGPLHVSFVQNRIDRVLQLVDLSFYDYLADGDRVHEFRQLIIHAHLAQCEKVISGLADAERVQLLHDLKAIPYERLRTNPKLLSAADAILIAVRDIERPWQVEGTLLHNADDWSNGQIRGVLRDALIRFFDCAVTERDRYEGGAWKSWVRIFSVFGSRCEDAEIARIVHEAASKPEYF